MGKKEKKVTIRTFKYGTVRGGQTTVVGGKTTVAPSEINNHLRQIMDMLGYDKSASSSGRFLWCLIEAVAAAAELQQKSLDDGLCYYTLPAIALRLVAAVKESNEDIHQLRQQRGVDNPAQGKRAIRMMRRPL